MQNADQQLHSTSRVQVLVWLSLRHCPDAPIRALEFRCVGCERVNSAVKSQGQKKMVRCCDTCSNAFRIAGRIKEIARHAQTMPRMSIGLATEKQDQLILNRIDTDRQMGS